MKADAQRYDLIIIGNGPAGMMASIYASRYRLSNLVIGKLTGGTITLAHEVENFPGFTSIPGIELAQKMADQVKRLGGEFLTDIVGKIVKEQDGFLVITESGQEYRSKCLIAASGTERRHLNIPGEKEYLGRGVSYCTNCDIPFFRDKIVALIGGSDAAVSGAIHAAGFVGKAYIIYRGEQLRAEPVWTDEALANPKIEVVYKTNLKEIIGDGLKVTGVKLDTPYQGKDTLPLDGVFIEIGGVPVTSLLIPLGVETDEEGFVKVTPRMETNIPGIFAAGDVTAESRILQQAITACSQGATAAAYAFKYLKGQQAPRLLGK